MYFGIQIGYSLIKTCDINTTVRKTERFIKTSANVEAMTRIIVKK